MKNIAFFYLILLTLLFTQNVVNGQRIIKSPEADDIVKGSDLIWFSENSNEINYIRLWGDERITGHEELIIWLKNALKCSANDDFKLMGVEDDEYGFSHYRYQQIFKGIPVQFGVYYLHLKNGKLHSANGQFYRINNLEELPLIDKMNAFETAKASAQSEQFFWNDLSPMDFAKGDLVVLLLNNKPLLCYRFDLYSLQPLDRSDYYIDARSGRFVEKIRTIDFANATGTANTKYSGTQKIVTDSVSSTVFRLRDGGRGNGIETFNMQKKMDYLLAVDFTDDNNIWTDTANQDNVATDIHYCSEVAYDYYLNVHNRNSFDGLGSKIVNYVHWDKWLAMSFWDGLAFSYGDGDGTSTNAYGSLDIVAHEFGHAINDNAASLTYLYEAGALLESFCDILAVGTDYYKNPTLANFMIGEKITLNLQPLRNLASPKTKLQPDTYKGTYWSNKMGEEWINSGVQNKWFFLLASGDNGINDKGDTFNVTGIGIEKAVKIAYRSLTNYLHPTANFNDARFYSIQSALDMYGSCSPEVISTTNAWYGVGVGSKYQADSLIADFTSNLQLLCRTPAEVVFQNRSSSATNYLWKFGDGETSSIVNPSHIYKKSGYYTVSLSVWDTTSGCNYNDTDTYVIKDYIYVKANPVLGFYANKTTAIAGYDVVTFYDTADKCVNSWHWEITPNDYILLSPNHDFPELSVSFNSAGYYSIKLVYDFGLSMDSVIKTSYILVTPPPVPDFTANNVIPRKDKDTIIISDIYDAKWTRKWTVSPSTYSIISTLGRDIKLIFHDTGFYDVTLETKLGSNIQTVSKKYYIKVIEYCTPSVTNINQDVGISLFKMGTINNATAIGMSKYTDYSYSHFANLSWYDTLDFELARNTTHNLMNRKIWIDWNIDGDFNDAGELVAYEPSASTVLYKGKIIVPGNATVGKSILRVGTSLMNMSNQPCGPNSYGEFEDYRVNIYSSPPVILELKNSKSLNIVQCEQNYIDSGYIIKRALNPIAKIDTVTNLNTADTGKYYIWYSVTDSSGFQAIIERTINVLPLTDLSTQFEFIGSHIDSVEVYTGYTPAGYNYNLNCNVIKSITSVGNVDTNKLGEYQILYILDGVLGGKDTVIKYVRVVDSTPPFISLLGYSDIYIDVKSSFVDPGVTVNDNYDKNVIPVVTGKVYTSWVGDYVISYSATDISGNGPSVVQRTVHVVDTFAPVVTSTTLNDGDTIVIDVYDTYVDPVLNATDNYSGKLDKSISGSFFSAFPDKIADYLGVFAANYIYTDSSGNSAVFHLIVIVKDREKPVITLYGPTVINLDSPKTFDTDSFGVSDNYDENVKVILTGDYFTKYLSDFKLGFYTIEYNATDSSGNKATKKTRYINVENYSDISEEIKENGFYIYPNPVSQNVNFRSENRIQGIFTISIYNSLGVLIDEYMYNGLNTVDVISINMGDLDPAMYLLRICSEAGNTTCILTKIK